MLDNKPRGEGSPDSNHAHSSRLAWFSAALRLGVEGWDGWGCELRVEPCWFRDPEAINPLEAEANARYVEAICKTGTLTHLHAVSQVVEVSSRLGEGVRAEKAWVPVPRGSMGILRFWWGDCCLLVAVRNQSRPVKIEEIQRTVKALESHARLLEGKGVEVGWLIFHTGIRGQGRLDLPQIGAQGKKGRGRNRRRGHDYRVPYTVSSRVHRNARVVSGVDCSWGYPGCGSYPQAWQDMILTQLSKGLRKPLGGTGENEVKQEIRVLGRGDYSDQVAEAWREKRGRGAEETPAGMLEGGVKGRLLELLEGARSGDLGKTGPPITRAETKRGLNHRAFIQRISDSSSSLHSKPRPAYPLSRGVRVVYRGAPEIPRNLVSGLDPPPYPRPDQALKCRFKVSEKFSRRLGQRRPYVSGPWFPLGGGVRRRSVSGEYPRDPRGVAWMLGIPIDEAERRCAWAVWDLIQRCLIDLGLRPGKRRGRPSYDLLSRAMEHRAAVRYYRDLLRELKRKRRVG